MVIIFPAWRLLHCQDQDILKGSTNCLRFNIIEIDEIKVWKNRREQSAIDIGRHDITTLSWWRGD